MISCPAYGIPIRATDGRLLAAPCCSFVISTHASPYPVTVGIILCDEATLPPTVAAERGTVHTGNAVRPGQAARLKYAGEASCLNATRLFP